MSRIKFNLKYFLLVFFTIGSLVIWLNFDKIMESEITKTKLDVLNAINEGNIEQVDSIIQDYIETEIKKEDEK